MKKLALVTLLAVGLTGVSQSANAMNRIPAQDKRAVDHMQVYKNINGWQELDQKSLIIWTTPSRPYLVKLARPSHDLSFVQRIGVTSMAGTVKPKFDSVVVEGMRYPISGIYALTTSEARRIEDEAA